MLKFLVASPLEQFEVYHLFYQNTLVDKIFSFSTLESIFTKLQRISQVAPNTMENLQCVSCFSFFLDALFNNSGTFLVTLQSRFSFFFHAFWFSNFSLFLRLLVFFLVVFPLVSIQRDPFSVLYRWSLFWLRVISFVANLAKRQLGRNGQRLFPVLYVVFTFICRANLLGMVPYSFTVTSHIFVTFTLSAIMFLNTIFLGVRYNGILFLRLLLPAGSPLRLAPLLVGVEFVSFVARVFSLAIRLFANMMSGHTLLKILAKFAWDMFKGGTLGIIGALLPCFLVFFVTRLEVGIAVLQAYVFTLLVSIYFSEAKRGGH